NELDETFALPGTPGAEATIVSGAPAARGGAMSVLIWLVPIALLMGAAGLAAFFWSLKTGQYEDMAGSAARILLDEDQGPTAPPTADRSDPARKRSAASTRKNV